MTADELTLRQAAAALGITREAVQKRIQRGRMRARIVHGARGRRFLVIARAEVERWKQARRVGSRLVPPAEQD
jgi:excisionase family DNA binding protein